MGELWGVYCEDLGENWLPYDGTALYCVTRDLIGLLQKCEKQWHQNIGILIFVLKNALENVILLRPQYLTHAIIKELHITSQMTTTNDLLYQVIYVTRRRYMRKVGYQYMWGKHPTDHRKYIFDCLHTKSLCDNVCSPSYINKYSVTFRCCQDKCWSSFFNLR